MQIVIVDDNKDAAASLSILLDMYGHGTRVAFNGAEAIKLCRERAPDAVILDLDMPVMDGMEAAQVLRNELPKVFLIAFSGRPEGLAGSALPDAGFDMFLEKAAPFARLCEGLDFCASRGRKA